MLAEARRFRRERQAANDERCLETFAELIQSITDLGRTVRTMAAGYGSGLQGPDLPFAGARLSVRVPSSGRAALAVVLPPLRPTKVTPAVISVRVDVASGRLRRCRSACGCGCGCG